MKVELIDFDGKMPNMALMRISSYHKTRGDSVVLRRGRQEPRLFDRPDKSYLSCVFRWNKKEAQFTVGQLDNCEAGGTGLDIHKELPEGITDHKPDYSLYPKYEHALGFISRGCIRKCPWCVVPRKEGELKRVATAEEIVGDKETAVFLDNNFLALEDCERDLKWLAGAGTIIDFNQALDARLVTDEIAYLLSKCSWYPSIRLSLDRDGMIKPVKMALDNLERHGVNIGSVRIFTLIGFDGLESDLMRLRKIHEWGAAPFPMGYRDNDSGQEPAKGWDRRLYKKYRRLIIRLPHAKSVWKDFELELAGHSKVLNGMFTPQAL